jgi:hypothetical protein
VHREIYNLAEPQNPTKLVVPPEFAASTISTRKGRVEWAPEYSYQDTTYRFMLKNQELGLHRADIQLRARDGHQILSVPLIWQRHPFLSSAPERIILANRSIRAFLRCPDENVEFARILSTPGGVKAVIESPREIRVALDNDAPGVINGVIKIATTANNAPPVRIPVIRYSSGSAGEKKPTSR